MRYLVVKNFERFQHYKNRNPPWIKLHAALLTDYEFSQLPDRSKGHLMLIWLLVSQRDDRRIPDDPKWVAAHLGSSEKIDLDILVTNGWLIPLAPLEKAASDVISPTLALVENSARAETETETEQRRAELVDDEVSVPELLESWNDICPALGLSAVRELSASRKQKAASRLREHPKVAFWNDVFREIRGSPFLLGQGPPNGKAPWRANFDWLIDNDTNCIKVAEGRYGKSQ